ncbi:MAG: YerC/YecD family TrpR-related protein [Candidatus Peribacteraceae bacterium]|nr:YerC/YecD family TrpR-related protein [Candidatus Peribacteraceae bacterium]MDD5074958.1 YerC/YecD family TrpR-related protein [Candidatus Peribacteraceae bacterium]
MGKRRFTEGSWQTDPWFRALVTALRLLKSESDIAAFLRDIATLSELQAWSERLEVARQLQAGKSYREVAINTGASTATVTRVAKFLENGSGYRSVLGGQNYHRHSSSLRGERMASKK